MKRRCFVIGPMKGENLRDLHWLAFKVVKRLLPASFEISTPEVQKTGNVMSQIIRGCDCARLVVANVTGNNPNVLCEMAALDALGRACIPVKIRRRSRRKNDSMVFDRAGCATGR